MITLTWTSMNIDAYKHHVYTGLQKLDELVHNINDIIENRIESNLRIVSKASAFVFVDGSSFSPDSFVRDQQVHADALAAVLQVGPAAPCLSLSLSLSLSFFLSLSLSLSLTHTLCLLAAVSLDSLVVRLIADEERGG
jgi:hypothetical protein